MAKPTDTLIVYLSEEDREILRNISITVNIPPTSSTDYSEIHECLLLMKEMLEELLKVYKQTHGVR